MAKKGTRPTKVSQQRAREEQWRRRATQAGGAVSVEEQADMAETSALDAPSMPSGESSTIVITSAPRPSDVRSTTATAARPIAPPSPATSASRTAATTAAAQRRAASAATAARNRTRLAPNSLSIDDEMYYVRSDVRRLVILTAVCLVVLLALFFVVPH